MSGTRRLRALAGGAAAALGCAVTLAAATVPVGAGVSAAGVAASRVPSVGTTARGAAAASGTPASGVTLPRDEAPHHDPVEWWYFNGHLEGRDAAGRLHSYGYEYVIFQFLGLGAEPLYYGDLSVSDLGTKSFHYGLEVASYPVPSEHDGFSLHAAGWTMSGRSGRDVLDAGLPGYHLDLRLTADEPATLHGRDGVVDLGPFGTSYYYSWTSLVTSGTVVDHGSAVKVNGLSWMDHEWGDIDVESGGGWDWFSVQLSDGAQYMLYFVRNKAGRIVATLGTRSGAGGSASLPAGSFGERATGSWTSPATHRRYSSGWELTVPGGRLTVTPDLLDQELDLIKSQGSVYWEGDCTISGILGGKAVSGVGYTELNPPGQV
ncbi:MAG TPA: lipocalin family protein [Acidimicrobiales bacterium]|nr:lipocalin family protein [Acidimicrobiales bacterium]